jgi:tetratricopeptide (TPR) repeat protein
LAVVFALTAVLSAVTVREARCWSSNRALFTRAVEVAPQNPAALMHLGIEEEKDQNLRAVLQLGERILAEDPNHYATLIRVGNLHWTFHEFDAALPPLLRARQLHPEREAAHFWLGAVYLDKAQFPEAETEFRKATELAPQQPDRHAGLAMALESQGKIEEAIREYRTELQLNPASARARQRLAALESR